MLDSFRSALVQTCSTGDAEVCSEDSILVGFKLDACSINKRGLNMHLHVQSLIAMMINQALATCSVTGATTLSDLHPSPSPCIALHHHRALRPISLCQVYTVTAFGVPDAQARIAEELGRRECWSR